MITLMWRVWIVGFFYCAAGLASPPQQIVKIDCEEKKGNEVRKLRFVSASPLLLLDVKKNERSQTRPFLSPFSACGEVLVFEQECEVDQVITRSTYEFSFDCHKNLTGQVYYEEGRLHFQCVSKGEDSFKKLTLTGCHRSIGDP